MKNGAIGKDKQKSSNPNEYYGHAGYGLNLGLALKISEFRISPVFGITSVKFKSTQETARGNIENSYSSKSNYIGVGLRYGDKYFIEIEPRKFIKEKKTSISLAIGFVIDF